MKLVDLVVLLNSLNIPVAFSHFKSTSISPAPNPPYITYTTPNDDGFQADNKNYHLMTDVDIELYTDKKDLQIEQQIEQLLNDNDLPFDSYQVYIDSEEVFQKTYEVRLI